MATNKSYNVSSFSKDISYLSCNICSSKNIVESRSSYVCQDCGIELEIQKFQYDRPYNEDIVQYHKGLGDTQIGTNRERLISPGSAELKRLQWHNSAKNNEKAIKDRAKIEISRLFSGLDLSDYNDVKKMVFDKFIDVRKKLRHGSKYRNISKLVSVITYLCLKLRTIPVNGINIVELSEIDKKEFNDFILQVRIYIPEYAERNRQLYILQRITEISETFNLGSEFIFLSKKILFKLWEGIKNTTDNVVAGLVSSIVILSTFKEKVSVSAVCKRLGIKMSTIQSQVKNKIVKWFNIGKFVSLVRSADLLKDVMWRLGLVKSKEGTLEQEEISSESVCDIVELRLGKAHAIFNNKNNDDFYCFALRGDNNTPLVKVYIKINGSPLKPESSKIQDNNFIDFNVYMYHSKDPPMIAS